MIILYQYDEPVVVKEAKMTNPRELVKNVANIFSLPDIYFRISQLRLYSTEV